MLALETHSLTKRFGKALALDEIDLSVEPGTVFGVIGPNGAGKTTTIRVLLDLIRPSSGTVLVLGEDPRAGGAPLRRRIGFLPGELRLDGKVTGRALLEHLALISGRVESGTIDALASRLGLDLTSAVRKLSKGNKQKLGVVQAFMHRPELLVLDEPTSGLDPLVQQEFLSMVREASADGQTVFLSSHVLSEIQQVADTVAILRAGRVLTVGSVESLRASATRRVTADIRDASPEALRSAMAALPQISDLTIVRNADTDSRAGAAPSTRITATVTGEIDPFVKTIARFTVTDLTVEEHDLEQSVIGLYSNHEGREGA